MNVVDRTSSEFKAYLELYQHAPLLELGQLADAERWRRHPDPVVTYIIDRNINYTNVCVADCQFCASAPRSTSARRSAACRSCSRAATTPTSRSSGIST
jgi:2-iminoacetate synthase ThiH